jgi:2-iminoacetate synthase
MSFLDIYLQYKDLPSKESFAKITTRDVISAISSEKKDYHDLLALLSEEAQTHLEPIAQKAKDLSLKHFGKAILLYTPLYLSNYCENQCLYCGFNKTNVIARKKLTLEEVKKEAEKISKTGLRHVLILTGESQTFTPISYIKDCVKILKQYFTSISIEIYPLKESEYKDLVSCGIDGLTLYQEVYDQKIYKQMHISGPKQNYISRIETVEKGAKCGIRTINIGALLGLADFRKEAFFLLLHAQYLQNKYPDIEFSISVPRLRPQVKEFKPDFLVSDKNIVQIILAARIFMPRLGITLSTRENQYLRDNLIPLGVTKMSAGSTTIVGGHSISEPYDKNSSQFEIADKRDILEMKKAILQKGYQPVLKDWVGAL